jgi:hypothetical protein
VHARARMESLRVAVARLVLSTMARRAAKTIISKITRATTIRRTATATMTAPLWSATALSNIMSKRNSVPRCILLALGCQQIVRPRTTTRTTGLRTAGFSDRGAARPRGSLLSFPTGTRWMFVTFAPTGTGAGGHRLKDPANTVAGQRVNAKKRQSARTAAIQTTAAVASAHARKRMESLRVAIARLVLSTIATSRMAA